jgi:hypothetical protein
MRRFFARCLGGGCGAGIARLVCPLRKSALKSANFDACCGGERCYQDFIRLLTN